MKNCGCGENLSCGCCEGIENVTPQATANRPGLSALALRIGTHSAFLETMLARLSNSYLDATGFDALGNPAKSKIYPLKKLNTRQANDASIALLDASAMMLDVLTFYQERIFNEGYLRTATERRSILELARLVGYTLRPGVSSSVYLAYTMDDKSEPVEIPIGARAQSIPAPGELPQSFETSEKLEARKEWNDLSARGFRPQNITIRNAESVRTIYFAGTETNLKANDPLLFVFESQVKAPVLRRVESVEPLFDDKKTKITLQLSIDNAVLQFIEQYMTNYAAFCIEADDALIVRAQELLDDFRKSATDDPNAPEEDEMLADAAALIIDIGESGNTLVQKWFNSLVNELIYTLRSLGVIDEWLDDIRETGSFDELMGDLNEFAAKVGGFKKLINILLKVDAFEELVDNVINIARTFKDFDEAKLKSFLDFRTEKPFVPAYASFLNLTAPLSLPPSKQPANSRFLKREAAEIFNLEQDTLPQMVTAFNTNIGTTAYQAWANTQVTKPLPVKVYALRLTAPLFGNTAPPRFKKDLQTGALLPDGEPIIVEASGSTPKPPPDNPKNGDASIDVPKNDRRVVKYEDENVIYLDSSYDKIVPGGWVVVDMSRIETVEKVGDKNILLLKNFSLSDKVLITRAKEVSPSIPRTDYGISGKTTRLELKDSWIKFISDKDEQTGEVDRMKTSEDPEFQIVRKTVVHAQSEALELAEEPINDDVCGSRIELGLLYEGLRAGRWIIVSGERTDISNTSGVRASELAMLSGIEQNYDPKLPGDKVHTTLTLANRLAYTYKRKTVKIYGNVVKATHGETRYEILGSGDAAQAMQTFLLKQPPLTYVSAPTTSGIESTLEVRVNEIKWHETDSLVELKPQDRKFVTKTDDEGKTTVVFGNGEQGARLPTGIENVKAIYRNGIGKPGNVKAEQISLLMTKPLGVREVINPLRASGGADKETRDQARRNIPVALMALDRLVSTKDYADFARTFAGIGKASAARLSDGRRQVVHLTIAGADNIPIDINSDLYNNLRRALAKYGDSFVPVQIATRELLALIIVANVRILSDYLWESVEPKIRAALLDAFSFERRELGQTVFLSEVISVIQTVEGVLYVDVDLFKGISESEIKKVIEAARTVAAAAVGADAAAAAQAARDEANKFTREPQKAAADFVAKAAEASAAEAGTTADIVKAAALKAVDAAIVIDDNAVRGYVAAKPSWFDKDNNKILPAQLACIMPDVPDTLILNKIEEVKK